MAQLSACYPLQQQREEETIEFNYMTRLSHYF